MLGRAQHVPGCRGPIEHLMTLPLRRTDTWLVSGPVLADGQQIGVVAILRDCFGHLGEDNLRYLECGSLNQVSGTTVDTELGWPGGVNGTGDVSGAVAIDYAASGKPRSMCARG